MNRIFPSWLSLTLLAGASAGPAGAGPLEDPIPLAGSDRAVDDRVLEALLAPGEFPGRRFTYSVGGDEALFVMDASLDAAEPFAEVHPSRVAWPQVAGLPLVVDQGPCKVLPARPGVGDEDLDAGIIVRLTLIPIGQRFDPTPGFAVGLEAVEVLAAGDRRVLLSWRADPAPPVCGGPRIAGGPDCSLAGLSREVRAAALSPNGRHLAMAVGGLRPRVEVYDIGGDPALVWQSLFAPRIGGPVEVAFSADGTYLAVLTGAGRLHRFDAATGGGHMAIWAASRAARGVPPGHVMAVGGELGEITLWYLDDGTIAWRILPRRNRGPVSRIAASGDGRRLATLEYDKSGSVVRIWEISKNAMVAQVDLEPYQVADIALDATGARLLVSHERRGLLATDLAGDRRPMEAGRAAGARCKGRLEWIPETRRLICAAGGDILDFDEKLSLVRTSTAGPDAAGLIVAAAAGANRLAAVGEGRLLVWREQGR